MHNEHRKPLMRIIIYALLVLAVQIFGADPALAPIGVVALQAVPVEDRLNVAGEVEHLGHVGDEFVGRVDAELGLRAARLRAAV